LIHVRKTFLPSADIGHVHMMSQQFLEFLQPSCNMKKDVMLI
jgi:hypothetical protein